MEMVFLPDPDADRDQVMEELVQASGPTANVVIASAATAAAGPVLLEVAEALQPSRRAKRRKPDMEIVDVVARSGATLVSIPKRRKVPELKGGSLYPVVNYRSAVADVRLGRSKVRLDSGPGGAEFLQIKLRSALDDSPIADAVAILRFRGSRPDISAVSDRRGLARFGVRARRVEGVDLLVEPGFAGHWGYFGRDLTFESGETIDIEPVNLGAAPDALRQVLTPGGPTSGNGVKVAVIDSGVGPHRDLPNVTGDHDSSIGHGTHVAGIIGGQGGGGWGGIAPGVEIVSYRVFDDVTTGVAKNFDIHRAIEQAVADGCHLINMSLKAENKIQPLWNDVVISRAVEDAADEGVLSVAAAGNDFRRFVSFPARHPDVLAVSALGWEPGLPPNAYDGWTVSGDRGSPDSDLYFARFSNEGVDGTNVDIVGPGAGIVSTVPGHQYAPMSGTSMACPAMTGTISRLLAGDPGVLGMAANRQRTETMRRLALQNLQQLGFGAIREGQGMVP